MRVTSRRYERREVVEDRTDGMTAGVRGCSHHGLDLAVCIDLVVCVLAQVLVTDKHLEYDVLSLSPYLSAVIARYTDRE